MVAQNIGIPYPLAATAWGYPWDSLSHRKLLRLLWDKAPAGQEENAPPVSSITSAEFICRNETDRTDRQGTVPVGCNGSGLFLEYSKNALDYKNSYMAKNNVVATYSVIFHTELNTL
ncbi:unnamed protein product [Euphydryas editha]|uniref:Uncharacterized protein n=1 Tax=Euphydryas editha TaxID=104508 RepID=A0AAU9UKH4_EUPED|nr:unnamed protein product [Euphydryas editha]